MSDNEEAHGRMTAEEMDERRSENIAYQYLCRLEESKKWMEACIGEEVVPTVELEEHLRNGVTLAKLAHFIDPHKVSLKKIYDLDMSRYQTRGLHFRHTDNINHFLKALKDISFPEIFYPETTDVYDRKNIPRLIYCLHALSLYMFKIGRAPQMMDLYGKIQFTEEEVSNMKRELDKYAITMPSFSKIGGILASEMPVDKAELHAAVIAINTAIDLDQPANTLQALLNPSAHLMNINEKYADDYQLQLLDAKNCKAESARNKSLDMDMVTDVYDELLTQAELQGNINHVNLYHTVAVVTESVRRGDGEGLLRGLKGGSFVGVEEARVSAYLAVMADLLASDEASLLTQTQVQQALHTANQLCHKQHIEEEGARVINQSLKGNDAHVTYSQLENPDLDLPEVQGHHAQELYHSELKAMRHEKQVDLSMSDISQAMNILNTIVDINHHIDSAHIDHFHASLRKRHAHLEDLDDDNDEKYLEELKKAKLNKINEKNSLLTYLELQKTINDVNNDVKRHHQRIKATEAINEALLSDDAHVTYQRLLQEAAVIEGVQEAADLYYHTVLKETLNKKKEETGDEDALLWVDEIQCCVDEANEDAREAENLSARVAAINLAVEQDEEEEVSNFLLQLPSKVKITKHLVPAYLACMQSYRLQKMEAAEAEGVGSGWMRVSPRGRGRYYFNVNSLQGGWMEPASFVEDPSILSKRDVENCLQTVNESSHLDWLFKAREPHVIELQAHARGWLVRRRVKKRKRFLAANVISVVVIQRWWRQMLQRLQVHRRMLYYQQHNAHVVRAQSLVRMHVAKKKYRDRLEYLKNNEASAIKIQSFVRTILTKKDYQTLLHGDKPSVAMIRKYLHLLDVTEKDYSEQIELDSLKQRLVQEIRRNQHLDHVLSEMDVKIGLLVKNRISLQDVVSQNKSLSTYHSASAQGGNRTSQLGTTTTTQAPGTHGGLKAFSKASHDKLQAYQHLFYLLQTQPHYLAKLIFLLPQSKTTKFVENAVLSIFNYAANHRDDFMLLGLFKTALQEEITSRITAPSDISTGNPMVVKLIVSFNRTPRGQNVLRELLGGLVAEVLEDKDLSINTNVVEVYKHWVNALEADSGKASGLPYDVTVEQALSHAEVSQRISTAISKLQQAADRFQRSILSNIHLIPYGMRYMAKVMHTTLRERFPETPEKEIIKVIGNFIYYRYINSAIVAPDAFDIINVAASSGLSNEQRRNLGSIAKILQFSASNKGFGTDSPHLLGMNKYIMEAHARFKGYFSDICDVEEPEVVFNIDQYSDISRVTKPLICISVGEVVDMHRLLLENQSTIAPSPSDPLHELLTDLGEVLPVEALLGEQAASEHRDRLAKTELTLTLSSKHELLEAEEQGLEGLWVRTKQMIVDILRCQKSGDSLASVFSTPATEAEENIHRALEKERGRQGSKTDASKVSRQFSLRGGQTAEGQLSLQDLKNRVQDNLSQLQQAGYVKVDGGYQTVFNSILKDFRSFRLQRQLRRKEMKRLHCTLNNLRTKRSFFEEQINYYNQYVRICLDRQAAKAKKKTTVRYTAARLHEKGVLLDVEGLKSNQFKNVLFDIASTDMPGLFIINAKLLGVDLERLELNFQDLLELQYEGQAIMRLFDRARVNVNILIHLLNKKFYSRK